MSRFALLVLLTHSVLVQAVTFVMRPTSTYRALELGVPATWLGVLSASFAIAPLILAVPSGHAVDRLGERRVMLVGSLLIGLAAGAFVLFGGGVAGLVAGSVLLGVGHLCSVVGQQAMVANRTPSGRHDTAFGYYTFAASLGQALGPSLILLFGGARTIPETGAIFLGTLGLAGVLVLVTLLVRPSPRGSTDVAAAEGGSVRTLLRRPGLVRALTVSCVVLAAVDITLVYLPALGTERGIASGTVGALLILRAAASMVSRFFLGRLSRRSAVAGSGRQRGPVGGRHCGRHRSAAGVGAGEGGRRRRARPRRRAAADDVVVRRVDATGAARPGDVAAADRQPRRPGRRPHRRRSARRRAPAPPGSWR